MEISWYVYWCMINRERQPSGSPWARPLRIGKRRYINFTTLFSPCWLCNKGTSRICVTTDDTSLGQYFGLSRAIADLLANHRFQICPMAWVSCNLGAGDPINKLVCECCGYRRPRSVALRLHQFSPDLTNWCASFSVVLLKTMADTPGVSPAWEAWSVVSKSH